MSGFTYDAGALVAAERRDERVWAVHETLLRRGVRPVVPAGVLARAWRGGPQAVLSRLLAGCRIEELDERRARAAGAACAATGTNDVVDASVVIGALGRGDVCVTTDPDDLRVLAAGLGSRLELLAL